MKSEYEIIVNGRRIATKDTAKSAMRFADHKVDWDNLVEVVHKIGSTRSFVAIWKKGRKIISRG